MKILITGVSGFLGQELAQFLSLAGHEIYGVSRSPIQSDLKNFVTPIYLDLHQLNESQLPQVDALITLAQSRLFRNFPDSQDDIFALNVTIPLRLWDWARKSGVKKIIHASSGGVYGTQPNSARHESDLLSVDTPIGFYLGCKLAAEIMLQNYRHFFESCVILRPFFMFGPRMNPDMFIGRLIQKIDTGNKISLNGTEGIRVNPVFVRDAAQAFAASLGCHGYHLINIAGPEVLTLKKLCQMLGANLKKEPKFDFTDTPGTDYVGDISQMQKLHLSTSTSMATALEQTVADYLAHKGRT